MYLIRTIKTKVFYSNIKKEVRKMDSNNNGSSSMDSKTTSIVGYITFIGLIIAYFAGTRDEKSLKHLNQSLMLCLIGLGLSVINSILFWGLSLVGFASVLSSLCGLAIFVGLVIGIVTAATDNDFKIPVIGDVKILK